MINRDNGQIRFRVGNHITGAGLNPLQVETPGTLIEDKNIPLLQEFDVLPHQEWVTAPTLHRYGPEQPEKNPEIPSGKIIFLGREIYRLLGRMSNKCREEGRDRYQERVVHREMVRDIENVPPLLRDILPPPNHGKVEGEAKEDE